MRAQLYRVDWTGREGEEVERLTRKGKVSARKKKRAQILLKVAEGWRDEDIMCQDRCKLIAVSGEAKMDRGCD